MRNSSEGSPQLVVAFSALQNAFCTGAYLALGAFIIIGIPLLFLIGIGSLVLAIVAAIKASDGLCYHYPLTVRLVS